MSEEPTYWKHKETGNVYRAVVAFDTALWADLIHVATGNCYTRIHVTELPLFYDPLPTPQVGETWTNGEETRVILSINPATKRYPILATYGNGVLIRGYTYDFFMLNFHKVEDAPKEEHPIYRPLEEKKPVQTETFDQHQNDLGCTRRDIEGIQSQIEVALNRIDIQADQIHNLEDFTVSLSTQLGELKGQLKAALEIVPLPRAECVHDWRFRISGEKWAEGLDCMVGLDLFYCTKCLVYKEKLTP